MSLFPSRKPSLRTAWTVLLLSVLTSMLAVLGSAPASAAVALAPQKVHFNAPYANGPQLFDGTLTSTYNHWVLDGTLAALRDAYLSFPSYRGGLT